MARPWWQDAVLYQVYPRSFADSNDDGTGDLSGVIAHLDYLAELGVDGIWLNPIYPSPNADWGYDVAGYCGVHPELGTLADVDRLIAEANARGIEIVLDLVPGHTSDRHPWFSDPAKRDWYIWSDGPGDGESVFGGSSWTQRDGAWYFHRFLAQQPQLNWFNEEVREAFDHILRFWFDRGVAGFRIDVAHDFVSDAHGNTRRDVAHEVLRGWRRIADSYDPPRVLIGETWIDDLTELMTFYGEGNELHMAFNFPFIFSRLEALPDVVARTSAALPEGGWPLWTLSNHDVVRFSTRMCGGDERKIRCALLALLTLPGTQVLYQGDELGLEQAHVPPDRVLDVHDRDGCRTPLPWTRDGGWRNPWLPLGDTTRNVAGELGDPGSILTFVRDVITRRGVSDGYEPISAPEGVWAYRRGERIVIALNLSDEPTDFEGRELGPWDGMILDVSASTRTR
jgi:alpha-glucosidase